MVNIYVLNKDGKPLMPIHSYGRAKRMLKTKRAHMVKRKPFTIQMNEQIEDLQVDECLLGIDPGRTNIGLCVIDSRGRILFASDVATRNKAVKELMLARKRARQAERRGRRLVRQRRAVAADKTGMAKHTEFWRMLPGCKKPVCCHTMRNKESRFNHRKRQNGWLTPTANHLLLTHLNAVELVIKMLPVATVVMEINRFDFARMENPNIQNWEYQMGKLAGYKDVDEAIHIQQKGRCLLCGKKRIDYNHHIIPVSQGGSDAIENRAGLCEDCHYGENGVHKSLVAKERLKKKKNGMLKKYHALSVINQIMPYLLKELSGRCHVLVTTGKETYAARKMYTSLPAKQKDDGTHHIDAWCIAISALDHMPEDAPDFEGCFYKIEQYRRHNRQRIHYQHERTYYLDGRIVAKNRHKRTGQADTKENYDSLAEFRIKHPHEVSHLTVVKSRRAYEDMDRILPGAEVLYKGKRHIVKGKHNERYTLADVDGNGVGKSKLTLLKRNTGLVFV